MTRRPGFGKVPAGFGAVLRTSFRKHSQGMFSLSGEASLYGCSKPTSDGVV